MFEFAISQQGRQPQGKRLFVAFGISCLLHLGLGYSFLRFPGLLRPGGHIWFHFPTMNRPAPEDSKWRSVAIVGVARRMQLPPAEILKKLLGGPTKEKGSGDNSTARVNGSSKEQASMGPLPNPVPQPNPGTPGGSAPASVAENRPSTMTAPVGGAGTGGVISNPVPSPGLAVEVAGGTVGAEKKGVFTLPAPSQGDPRLEKKTTENPSKTTPNTIPNALPPIGSTSQQNPGAGNIQKPKVFEDKQAAIKNEGTGFFDTKGFPLGDYATVVIDRIKGNWMIPSTLRQSQGRTTVVFYIEKDGQPSGIQVVTPSGSQSLDLAALSSVLGQRFPPLPSGFPGDRVGAKILFSYNERQ